MCYYYLLSLNEILYPVITLLFSPEEPKEATTSGTVEQRSQSWNKIRDGTQSEDHREHHKRIGGKSEFIQTEVNSQIPLVAISTSLTQVLWKFDLPLVQSGNLIEPK